ncbi:MAG: TauD/TfdA family dioxygenase [Alphaproteobacteria bacterium]|nr:TauD/TfdA family dioxygenase [Alphaproteobacteria bacterium]
MRNEYLDVRPIAGALGAEVHGVDLAEDMDDETFDAVHQALLDNGVIFFRDQDITPGQQLAFAKRWGSVHLHPHLPCLPDYPGVLEIIKDVDDRANIGGFWHTDQMFTPTPARATMLYAKELPPVGGDTMFANLYMAYDTLSDGMKAMIADLNTVNLYNKKKERPAAKRVTMPEEDPKPAEHPLVRPHNETGKPVLYISYSGITRHIAGMTESESRPLLDYLLDHATRPEFTCRFRWEPGSIALWDNRCVLHLALNDYHGYRRVMHRITIESQRTH